MNAVTVLALVTRSTTQQVTIHFDKKGHGDDIVDQWADRLLDGMKATVSCTVAAATSAGSKSPEAEMRRTVPQGDEAQRYYWVTYHCGNCRWVNMAWFLKGKPAPKSIVCEKCECQTC